jgi:hypothetical protein
MSRHLRRGFGILSILAIAGCGDTADTLLRTGSNYKSELTDRLMKVTDEQSARAFIDQTMKTFTEKNKALSDKWEKWIKEIEDDYRGKLRVVNITSSGQPGSEQWEKDLRAAENKKDDKVIATREAFIDYMRKITADAKLFEREQARIADLVKHLTAEEKAKGGDAPNPQDLWPNLVKIAGPDAFKNLLLAGAVKKAAPGAP